MIVGIGSDLCDIRRVEKSLERFGERFTHRIFTDIERARSDRNPGPAASYAKKRFAAKEGLRQGARHRHALLRLLARHAQGW